MAVVVRVAPLRRGPHHVHSQLVEWISGSFIQSHWPWLTLCPISMFSMDFAYASAEVPTIQPARERVPAIVNLAARSGCAERRWSAGCRTRPWRRGLSSTSLRMRSSSAPNASTSALLMFAYAAISLIATLSSWSDCRRRGADHLRCASSLEPRARSAPQSVRSMRKTGAMTTAAATRVAVYLDFDNIVISRYDQVNGRNSFQRDKAKGLEDREAGRAPPSMSAPSWTSRRRSGRSFSPGRMPTGRPMSMPGTASRWWAARSIWCSCFPPPPTARTAPTSGLPSTPSRTCSGCPT